MCAHTACHPPMLRCSDNTCIPQNLICDGYEDCKDGSDENLQLCRHSVNTEGCAEGEVLCPDGRCAPTESACVEQGACSWRSCPQLCLPKHEHNFTCKCVSGYKQRQLPDGSLTCEAGGRKGGETGGFAYRARMHRLFAELEPSVTVTEQNLADRVRYILRSNTFDVTELERLRREAVPSSGENAAAEDAAPQLAEQTANVDAAVNTPVVVDSNDDGTVAQELELEQMRSTLEEAIVETRSTTLENRPRLPRLALSKRNRAVVRALNPMLVTYLEASRDLCDTDSILFGAALAVCRIIGAKLSTAGRATGQSSAIPAWRIRIEERIAKARALIGRLICFRSGNTRPRIVRTVRMAFAGTNVSLSQPDIMQKLTERIDDLKQRIAAWGKRIRRYTERSTRFNQNRLFQSDQKRLYKSLERPIVSGTGPAPNQADMVAFWRSLWSEPVNHNEGPWTEVVASQCASITPMDPVIITPDDVAEAVRRAPNWKSPGLDGLHHYWLKGFMVCHSVLARQFQEALNQKSLPSLFTTGITHLVPKDQGATDPSKYRPITCEKAKLIVAVGGTLRLWELNKHEHEPEPPEDPERSYYFLLNLYPGEKEKLIVAVGGTLRLWELNKHEHEPEPPEDPERSYYFLLNLYPGEKEKLIVAVGGTLRLWELNKHEHEPEPPEDPERSYYFLLNLYPGKKEKLIVAVGGTLRLWELNKHEHEPEPPEDPERSYYFLLNLYPGEKEKLIVAVGGTLRLWELNKHEHEPEPPEDPERSYYFLLNLYPGKKEKLIVAVVGTLRLWEVNKHEHEPEPPEDPERSYYFLLNLYPGEKEKLIVAVGGTLRLWELNKHEHEPEPPEDPERSYYFLLNLYPGEKEKLIVAVGGTLRLWELKKHEHEPEPPEDPERSYYFLLNLYPGEKAKLVVAVGGTLRLWELNKHEHEPEPPEDPESAEIAAVAVGLVAGEWWVWWGDARGRLRRLRLPIDGTPHALPTRLPPMHQAETIIQDGGIIRGVAVDWISKRLYWTAVEGADGAGGGEAHGVLAVAALDGRRRVTLWRRRGAEPDDLVLSNDTG
ncbi:unnamed protein product [Parnassius apollo]|uniref:(apollo) hypothetical protein n=1 Tax=Parnassius apollo TaxID=110799 RepID=A0A8S3XAI9_PARAO|nr:unnamed protein product [Parnassius apollo]